MFADVRPFTVKEEARALAHAKKKSAASRRRRQKRPRKDSKGIQSDEKALRNDIIGARGELAFAIFFFDGEWDPKVDDFVNPDFSPDIEIRTTALWTPTLILREGDVTRKTGRRYVLIQEMKDRHHRIWGWVRPSEVVKEYIPEKRYDDDWAAARWIGLADLHRFPFYEMVPKRHERIVT